MVARSRKGKRRRARRHLLLGGIVVAILLAGFAYHRASTKLGAEQHFARAQSLLEQGQRNAALIEAKNALQADPTHAESRVLAGNLYLFLGDGLSAEKELGEAIKLGFDTPEVHFGLLRALLQQRRFEEVIGRLLELGPDSHSVESYLIRGSAWLGSGSYEHAREDFDNVLALDPDNAEAHRGLTKLALASEDLEEAGRQIDKTLAVSTSDLEGWVLKGEVQLLQKDFAGAENAFVTALESNQNHLLARVGLTRSLLAQNKPDEALQHIEVLANANPYSAVNSYLAALAFRQKGDIPSMQLALREVLKVAPYHPASLLMLGAIHYRNDELELAQQMLSRFVEQQPDDLRGSKLLGAVLMKQAAYDQAISLLEEAVEANPDDPQLLALLGSAYMATKDYENANAYMTRATQLEPDIASLRTQLALTHFATGDADKGISELQSIVAANPEIGRADYLLLLVHLRKHEYAEALAIAKQLAQDQPDNPVPYNLIAAANEGLGDAAKARVSYERALEIKPDYVTAALNLARLDYQDGDIQATKDRYAQVLTIQPGNVFALEGLARFALQERRTKKATQFLERARAASSTAVNPRILLVGLYLQTNPQLALEIAQEAHALAPQNSTVLQALGRSHLVNQQFP